MEREGEDLSSQSALEAAFYGIDPKKFCEDCAFCGRCTLQSLARSAGAAQQLSHPHPVTCSLQCTG